jgi:hypothetical protein
MVAGLESLKLDQPLQGQPSAEESEVGCDYRRKMAKLQLGLLESWLSEPDCV